MAKDITKDLLETIKKTLPETQVGLIKDALVERDKLKSEVLDLGELLKDEKDRRRALFDDFSELNKEHEELKVKFANLETENNQLKKYNEEFIIKDVERRAAEAQAELRGVQTTQELFLKNTIVRETVQTQMPVQGTSVQTQYVNGQAVQVPTSYTSLQPVKNTTEKTTDSEET